MKHENKIFMNEEFSKEYTHQEAIEFLKAEGLNPDELAHEGSVFMRVLHEKIDMEAKLRQYEREIMRLKGLLNQ